MWTRMRLLTLLVVIAATIMTTLADGETEMTSRTLYAEDAEEAVNPSYTLPHPPPKPPSGTTGSGGSSSGGSSGGSGGGGGSSGGSGGGGGGSGGGGGKGHHGAAAGGRPLRATLMAVGAAVVASAVIAAVVARKRRVVTEEHPLAGSLDKRIKLFSTLASQQDQAARPARRIDGDDYHLESDGRVWAV